MDKYIIKCLVVIVLLKKKKKTPRIRELMAELFLNRTP